MNRDAAIPPLQEILASILDGRAPDWDAAQRSIAPDEQSQLDALHDVAEIAAFHRSLQRGAKDSDAVDET